MAEDTATVEPLELSIDSASEIASVALTRAGSLLAERTWKCGREQSRQLLPAIDELLTHHGETKDGVTAVFVCTGPGTYAGVRACVSIAKGLAYGLEVPLVGVGRLEIQAYAFAAAGTPIAALHRAGRGRIAWAAYVADPDWHELVAPRTSEPAALAGALPASALVPGDIDSELAMGRGGALHRRGRGAATIRHAALLAELGWLRLQAGETDDPKSLVPLYLREPAIGPQK